MTFKYDADTGLFLHKDGVFCTTCCAGGEPFVNPWSAPPCTGCSNWVVDGKLPRFLFVRLLGASRADGIAPKWPDPPNLNWFLLDRQRWPLSPCSWDYYDGYPGWMASLRLDSSTPMVELDYIIEPGIGGVAAYGLNFCTTWGCENHTEWVGGTKIATGGTIEIKTLCPIYNPTKAYIVGEVACYNGDPYICGVAHGPAPDDHLPTDDDYWHLAMLL